MATPTPPPVTVTGIPVVNSTVQMGVKEAEVVTVTVTPTQPPTPDQSVVVEDLPTAIASMNFREQKNLAKLLKIRGYSGLRQGGMVAAILAKEADILPSHIEKAKEAAKEWKKEGKH